MDNPATKLAALDAAEREATARLVSREVSAVKEWSEACTTFRAELVNAYRSGALVPRADMAEGVEVVKGLEQFFVRPDENSVDKFDRIAEQFRRETGMFAPGKDAPSYSYDDPAPQDRREQFDTWVESKAAMARAFLARHAASDGGGA